MWCWTFSSLAGYLFYPGILPEDLIISVDGESIVGLTLNDAVEKIRGPIGSNVKIFKIGDNDAYALSLIHI